MKKTILILVVIILIAGLAACAYFLIKSDVKNNSDESLSEESVKTKIAPLFTVFDGEGNEVTLESFKGKPVVLNFWAASSDPSRSEMPFFQQAYEKYGDRVTFIMVNLDDSADKVKSFLESNGYTFPVYYDKNNDAVAKYSVKSFPRTFVIDSEGEIIKGFHHAIHNNKLAAYIELALDRQ